MIYLDNAASTRPSPEALQAWLEASRMHYANPSSAHAQGAAAARLLAASRASVMDSLAGKEGRLVFTSGGSESNALGVLGAVRARRERHIVVSAIEHPSVLETVSRLGTQEGFEVTVVAPNRSGIVEAAAVVEATRDDTALVAVMLVNNEVGTLQPLAEMRRALAEAGRRVHIHVDAVQAMGTTGLSVSELGANTVALSGHKFHAPRGVGALWIAPRTRIEALWGGGGHENGLRSGTQNLPGIAAMAVAARQAVERQAAGPLSGLRDQFESEALGAIPGARPTVAPGTPRAPHISSLRFAKLPAEPLLHALEARGVSAAAGSACASKKRGPSHVLQAIGVAQDDAVLRFSFAHDTSPQDVSAAVLALQQAVAEIQEVTAFSKRR